MPTARTHASERARVAMTAFVATLLLVVLVQPASAAAPRLIVIEGGQLDEPKLLTDWDENLTLMTGRTGAFQQPDESRPHFDVLEYWLTSLPADLSPTTKLGDPQARYPFYPATGDDPAVLGGYAAEQKALDVLERHGVPTRVEWSRRVEAEGRPVWLVPLIGVAAIAVLCVAAGGFWHIRARGRVQ